MDFYCNFFKWTIYTKYCNAQEAGGILIGVDGLVEMAGGESYQIPQTHGSMPFHSIRSIPAIIMSHPPLSSLHCWNVKVKEKCVIEIK
jgi:hypothetical protein